MIFILEYSNLTKEEGENVIVADEEEEEEEEIDEDEDDYEIILDSSKISNNLTSSNDMNK